MNSKEKEMLAKPNKLQRNVEKLNWRNQEKMKRRKKREKQWERGGGGRKKNVMTEKKSLAGDRSERTNKGD